MYGWFFDTFLPSLEERYKQRGGKLWLTKKQTDICRREMRGSNTVRGAYETEHAGKVYGVQIAPNGCGRFWIMENGFIIYK